MYCQRFAAAAGPGSHVHTAMPSFRARPGRGTVQKADLSPAVHSVDDDAPSERLSARPRRLAAPSPAPFPLAGRLRRTCGASGPDSGKAADGHPRHPAGCGTLGRRALLGPLSATAIGLTSPSESALDITGPGRQASPCCSPARTEAGTPGGTSTAPRATAREPRLLARATPKRRTRRGRRLP